MWLLREQIFAKCPAGPDQLKSRRQREDKYGVWEGEGARGIEDRDRRCKIVELQDSVYAVWVRYACTRGRGHASAIQLRSKFHHRVNACMRGGKDGTGMRRVAWASTLARVCIQGTPGNRVQLPMPTPSYSIINEAQAVEWTSPIRGAWRL